MGRKLGGGGDLSGGIFIFPKYLCFFQDFGILGYLWPFMSNSFALGRKVLFIDTQGQYHQLEQTTMAIESLLMPLK